MNWTYLLFPPSGEEDLGLSSMGEELPPPEEDLPEFPSPEEMEMPEKGAGYTKPPYYEKEESAEMPKPSYYRKKEMPERLKPSYYRKREVSEEEVEEIPSPLIKERREIPETEDFEHLESRFGKPSDLERSLPEKPFIRIEDFKTALDEISLAKNGLKDLDNIFASLNDVKSEKDSQFEKWQKIHSDIQRKFIYIDKILFK